ncbi:parathyroid hormone 2 receptor-like isoform X3 [Biomphalaria glabrata]|uniref:Parathyroid hormone 2 receptor-like isoform X3 n=1 Tax=Biomphalaria glabrata TaxID=6526 RepID=A0A9W2ZP88_BIOGL|nr:parathyroid hormone 2 receptor-like isoform X3 [Biomphalaria glabrata]
MGDSLNIILKMETGNEAADVASVMSIKEQRILILKAKQKCFRAQKEWDGTNMTSEPMCNMSWDGLTCWDPTPGGVIAEKPCPSYISGFYKNEVAKRTCNENGTWWVHPTFNREWTNYSNCYQPSIDLSFHTALGYKLKLLYTIGYSFSIGALLVAIVIMLCCKRLHSKSNTLHINLFLTFILRAVISFLKDSLFVSHLGLEKDVLIASDGSIEFIQDDDHWECKLLITIFIYSSNACNMWIFSEAVYLTMLVYRPLTTERRGVKVYIVLGWSLSFVFIIPWIIVKALYEDRFCWNFQHNLDYYWIIRGSGVGVVVINFFLFLNIFRKLFLKLRQSSNLGVSGKSKYRKLAKFILVLIPLFGIMYLVFYVAVPSNFEETQYNLAYLYLEMGYNSFQGLLLALLFCFLNEEVHIELKRAWLRHKNRRMEMSIINRSFNNFHSSHRKTMSCNSREDDSKIGICPTSGPKGKELYRLRTFSVSSENNELTRVTTSNSFKCPHRVCAQFDDSSLTRYGNINPVFPQSTCGPRTNSLTGKLVTTKFVNPESIHQKTLNEPNNFRSQDLNQESSKTHLLTQEDKEEQEKD